MFLRHIRILVLLIWVFIFNNNIQAQTIFVFDQQTGEPINNVYVYSSDKKTTGLTDKTGIVDISQFEDSGIIHFQHTSYYTLDINKQKFEKLKFRLGMIENFVKLNEVVVSASKWEENATEIPNIIEVIKRKDIIFSNPETSASMLESGGEVFVQRSQMGGGSPMLRGFAANKILFIVDGVRMNNAIYRSGNLHNVLQADVNTVEAAEVIFGPGTNIYGSDALGGVIDLHMMKPKFTDGKKWNYSGHGLARLSTANFERTLHTDINASNEKWAFLASFTYSAFDDLKMGSNGNEYLQRSEYISTDNGIDSIYRNENQNEQKFSAYNQMSFIGKLSNRFSESVSWTYNLYLTTSSDVPRYDRLIEYDDNNKLKYAVWNYSPQQWVMNSLDLNFSADTKVYDNAMVTLAYQNVKEGRQDRKYRDEWLRIRDESVNIFSINTDFDKKLNAVNSIYYGLEIVYNDVQSTGVKQNIHTNEEIATSSRYPHGGSRYFQSGAYLSYKKNFSNIPATFQAGARYSYVSLYSKFTDNSFYDLPYDEIDVKNSALTGSTGFVYHPGSWQLTLNLSSGFRAPNLDDVAKIFDSEPGNVVVPNENLNPEYLYNAEAGVQKKFQNKASIQFSAFYSYLDNAMVRRDFTLNGQDSIMYDGEMSKVQAVVNAGYAKIYGGSLLVTIQLAKHLGFKSAFTYIKGIDDEGFTLRHAPPMYGTSSLVYEKSQLKMEISSTYNTIVTYDNLAPTERAKPHLYAQDENGNPYSPEWWTLNYRMSYSFSDKFIANLGVENILDKRFMSYSSGIAASGRNFVFSVRYSF